MTDRAEAQAVQRQAAPNRALIAAAGFAMQLAFGSVYGWSVFLNPLRELYGASKLEVGLAFTVTLAVLGIVAGFGGALQRRFGPRAVATLAGLLYGAGVFLSGLAPSLPVLYLTYGLMGGVGLGLGYIVPLAVLIPWFPDKRGFITGLTVAGFGLGAFAASPLATALIGARGVGHAFLVLGAAYLVLVVAAAQFLRAAPEDYAPPGWTPARQASSIPARDHVLSEALRTPLWPVLWLILALNVSAGAALLSVASPLAQEMVGAGTAEAAALVSVMSVFNGVGRLLWGGLSDRIGRATTFFLLFAIQAVTFAAMAAVHDFAPLLACASVAALCYGGGFGTMPAYAADVFGPKHAGTVYGAMLTAWSAGAVIGPVLIASLPYRTALLVIVAILAAAAPLPLLATAMARRLTKV